MQGGATTRTSTVGRALAAPVPDGREPDVTAAGAADPARRFRRVVAVAAVPYLWALTDLWNGTVDLLRTNGPDGLGQVYDVQARAMLHGRLSLPAGSIGPEAFVHDGRTYTYFGVFPSLIRIPVLLVTHAFDGRLTTLSLLLAWLVTALAGAGLLWPWLTCARPNAL